MKEAYAKRLQDPKFRKKNKETVRQGAFVGDVDSDEEQSVAAGYTMTKDLLRPRVKTGKDIEQSRPFGLERVVTSLKELKWEHNGHGGGLTNTEKKRQ